MAKARSDREAKAGELYANLIQKVWKVKLGIIAGNEKAAVEMLCPGRQDFGVNFDYWKKLGWVTRGQAAKAQILCNALVAFLRSGQPIEEGTLWSAVARVSPLSFEDFEAALFALEEKVGRSARTNHATQAFHIMVGMEAHERD